MKTRTHWGLLLMVLALGCSAQPGLSPAVALPPIELPPGDVAPVPPPQTKRIIQGQVTTWNGQPLAGATVTAKALADGRQLAESVASDQDGRYVLIVPDYMPAPAVVQLTATKGPISLHAIASNAAIRTQLADTGMISFATSIASRAILAKMAEVYVSLSGTAASRQRLVALLERFELLTASVESALRGTITDQRVQQALDRTRTQGTTDALNELIRAVVEFSPAASDFAAFIEQCNRDIIANFAEGGPYFWPSAWGSGGIRLDPPVITEDGEHPLITYQGHAVRLTVGPNSRQIGQTLADRINWLWGATGGPVLFIRPANSGGPGGPTGGNVGVQVTPTAGGNPGYTQTWSASPPTVTTTMTVTPGGAPTGTNWTGPSNAVNSQAAVTSGNSYSGTSQWDVGNNQNTVYGQVTVTNGNPFLGQPTWQP
jgi:hypothetical protein